MDAPSRNWLGTLQAAFVLLGACLVLAVPLTWYRNSRTHLENQGVDLVHHLLIAHEYAAPGGPDAEVLEVLASYPAASHRMAGWSAPLFGGDALAALRYASCAAMLALLALPYVLLCRAYSPLPALALVLAWHLACYHLKVGGLNHFMWEHVYNYSRAIGMVGFWMTLIALSTPSRGPTSYLATQAVATACACFALACHIGPGAVAFGAILACQVAWWLRDRTAVRLAAPGVTLAAAAGMVLGTTVWTLMVKVSNIDGGLQVGPHAILLLWVPTLLVGLALYFVRMRRGFPAGGSGGDALEMALVAALLSGGLLQAYLGWKMAVAGSVAPYAVKSIYFLTFPVAALLLIRWAGRLPMPELHRGVLPACRVTAIVLLGSWLGARWHKDGRAPNAALMTPSGNLVFPTRDQLPDVVTRRLGESSDELAGYFYFDPLQINASYYANVAGLRVRWKRSNRMYLALLSDGGRLTPKGRETLARAGFVGLALPDWAEPTRDAPGLGPGVRCGRFWKCPLPDHVVAAPPAPSRR